MSWKQSCRYLIVFVQMAGACLGSENARPRGGVRSPSFTEQALSASAVASDVHAVPLDPAARAAFLRLCDQFTFSELLSMHRAFAEIRRGSELRISSGYAGAAAFSNGRLPYP